MTTYYVDSSVGMYLLTGASPSAATWFDGLMADAGNQVISSRILQTEMIRTCRRDGDDPQRAVEFSAAIDLIPIGNTILQLAELIEPHLKTLDAIHLASVLALGDPEAVVATHDARMRTVARGLGFVTVDPVEAA